MLPSGGERNRRLGKVSEDVQISPGYVRMLLSEKYSCFRRLILVTTAGQSAADFERQEQEHAEVGLRWNARRRIENSTSFRVGNLQQSEYHIE